MATQGQGQGGDRGLSFSGGDDAGPQSDVGFKPPTGEKFVHPQLFQFFSSGDSGDFPVNTFAEPAGVLETRGGQPFRTWEGLQSNPGFDLAALQALGGNPPPNLPPTDGQPGEPGPGGGGGPSPSPGGGGGPSPGPSPSPSAGTPSAPGSPTAPGGLSQSDIDSINAQLSTMGLTPATEAELAALEAIQGLDLSPEPTIGPPSGIAVGPASQASPIGTEDNNPGFSAPVPTGTTAVGAPVAVSPEGVPIAVEGQPMFSPATAQQPNNPSVAPPGGITAVNPGVQSILSAMEPANAFPSAVQASSQTAVDAANQALADAAATSGAALGAAQDPSVGSTTVGTDTSAVDAATGVAADVGAGAASPSPSADGGGGDDAAD